MTNTSTLKRELGLWDVFSIAAGAMISSGLFVLPGIVFAKVGPVVIFAYLLAGVLYLPAMIAKAELASALPRAGGTYFFVERSFGPFMGTLAGIGNWLSLGLKTAFAFVGIGTLVVLLVPEAGTAGIKAGAIGACVLFTVINLVSVKGTGRVQRYFVVVLVGILVVYVVAGFFAIDPSRYQPFMFAESDAWTFFTVTGMVFISYGGLTIVVDVAEEVRNPQRNVPMGMFLAFSVLNLLYVGVVLVTVGVVDADILAGHLAPVAVGAGKAIGPLGKAIVTVAALLAYATTGNAGILSASRSPLAMGRDGLLPARFSVTSKRFGTPSFAIIMTSVTIIAVISLLSVEDLVKAASAVLLLCFILLNLCVFVMRKSGIEGYRPTFRAPFFPWVPAFGIVVYALLIVRLGLVPLAFTACVALIATGWYLLYVPKDLERQPAVIQLVRRILEKHLQRTGLEQEMLEIKLERDNVLLDRFDRLVQDCPVLDLAEAMDSDAFFRALADAFASPLGMTEHDLHELFLAREQEASTVIEPGLAVPHVVVPGEGVFHVAIVRCRGGIRFPDEDASVTTAFALVGSADERQFHLQALMAVANVVCEPGFQERWAGARGADQLRDVVLLSGRRRMA